MTAVSTFPPKAPRWRVVRTLVAREYASKRTYRLAFVLDLLFGIANLFVYYFICWAFWGPIVMLESKGAFAALRRSRTLVAGLNRLVNHGGEGETGA